MNYLNIFGWIVIVISAGMAIFQILLASGVPLGDLAWGGFYKKLPLKLRIGSFLSALLFILAILVVGERIVLFSIMNSPGTLKYFIWFFFILFSLSTVANIMSKSKMEKRIMLPIAVILAFSFLMLIVL